MKKFAIAVACLVAGLSFAQTPAVLIEVCNAVPDADKRLECLKAAMGTTSAVTPKTSAVDALERAFGAMQAGLDIGMSYRDYQSSVLDLARALSAFKQQSPETDYGLLDEALTTYNDAAKFWNRSIEFYAQRGNDPAHAGGLPVGMNGLDWMVVKYDLTTVKSGIWGLERGLPVQTTRSKLWTHAKEKSDEGLRVARAPAVPKAPPAAIDPEMQAVHDLVKAQNCRKFPSAEKTGTQGTDNLYFVTCMDGRSMSIACADGACRVLK